MFKVNIYSTLSFKNKNNLTAQRAVYCFATLGLYCYVFENKINSVLSYYK